MEVGSKGVVRECGMSVEILPMRFPQSIFGQCLEDGLAIPLSNNPSGHVLHESGFFIAIAFQLLQELAISFGENHRIQCNSGGSHFNHITLNFLGVKVVKIKAEC